MADNDINGEPINEQWPIISVRPLVKEWGGPLVFLREWPIACESSKLLELGVWASPMVPAEVAVPKLVN